MAAFLISPRRSLLNFTKYHVVTTCKVSLLGASRSSCDQRVRSTFSFSGKTTRIGCSSGFWGDTSVAAPQLIYGGDIEFLVSDYLSEITMSLLTAAKQKNPDLGYTPDFVQSVVAHFLNDIKSKGIRLVSNAGGVNPHACSKSLLDVASKVGITDLKVAVITGDDMMNLKSDLGEAGVTEMDSGAAFPKTVHSMNAYLGAAPIARALDLGANIVVTGRCVDSALVLGPLLHKFKWSLSDYDKLSAGSLAGHLVECGAQATGGIFTDWDKVPDWDKIGFPIVEVDETGNFVLSKPPKTGGLVNRFTASEQLLYELGDPAQYVLPDVTCDFTNVGITDVEGVDGGAVAVSGAKGVPPTDTYKVSATYADGFRATAVCPIGGPRAREKAEKTTQAIFKRCRRMFKFLGMEDFRKVHTAFLGSEDMYGPLAQKEAKDSRELVIWMSVHHSDKKALELFAREIAPAGTGMAPGLTNIVGGRPRVSPVLKLFSFLHRKSKLKVDIHMNGEHVENYVLPHVDGSTRVATTSGSTYGSLPEMDSGSSTYRLGDLAYTRSGDKGNNCNIGVIARHPSYVPYIKNAVTPEAVEHYFHHTFEENAPLQDRVKRYDVPGINGFNFVLKNSLGGGGVASLRTDPQGKAMGQMLLDFRLDNMPNLDQLNKT